ncbi:MAG: CBS domain-containing protein [Myxococcota bacterium]
MKCQDIMKKDVQCCTVDDTAATAAARMRDANVGFMPVCDQNGIAQGTVTDRDLCIRVLADSKPADTKVSEAMSARLICCGPEDDLKVAEDLMREHKVSRIVCTDNKGKPLGVISLSDIADVERRGRAADVLKSVSHRELRM